MLQLWKHTKWNKPDTMRQILHDSIKVKYLKKATLYRQKVDKRLIEGWVQDRSIAWWVQSFCLGWWKVMKINSGNDCTKLWM